jgi:hypothetical protein
MKVLTKTIWQVLRLVIESDELEIRDFYSGKNK